ncbi:MAG: hypothetical protein MJ252_24265 [archaeon]|nr:hypothetical protein [archaeon]
MQCMFANPVIPKKSTNPLAMSGNLPMRSNIRPEDVPLLFSFNPGGRRPAKIPQQKSNIPINFLEVNLFYLFFLDCFRNRQKNYFND